MLISTYHPVLKRLFSKGARTIEASWKLDYDKLKYFLEPENHDHWLHISVYDESRRCLRHLLVPLLHASQDILGLGNVCLTDVIGRLNPEAEFF